MVGPAAAAFDRLEVRSIDATHAITWPGCKLAKRSAFRDRFFIDPEFDYANFS
jgi:hypothetical protein